MAPIEVIDLTSSPEPEDTPARKAALAQFQPRKEKKVTGHGTPSIPVNGLPLFYENEVEQAEQENGYPSRQEAQDLNAGARSVANAVPIGSFAPTARGEGIPNVANTMGVTAPSRQVFDHQSRASVSAISHGPVNRNIDPRRTPGSLLHAQTLPNRSDAHSDRPLRVAPRNGHPNGHRRPSVPEGTQRSSNGAQLGASRTAQDRLDAYHANLIEHAQPLKGLSPQSLARLYQNRDALVGTPLEYALNTQPARDVPAPTAASGLLSQRQRQLPAQERHYPCPMAQQYNCSDKFTDSGHAARHARIHTGEKKYNCPKCTKGFSRSDNMETHRQRCKALNKASTSAQLAAPVQQRPPPLTGADLDCMPEQLFNPLKRSLPSPPPTSDYKGSPNGTSKKVRVDLTTPEPRTEPRRRFQLVDVTDEAMEPFVYSDESKNQSQESMFPKPALRGPRPSSPDTAHAAVPQPADDLSSGPSQNGLPYSAEEDALLKKLKEVYGLPWHEVPARFSGRTQGSLQVRYHTLHKREYGLARPRGSPSATATRDMRSQVPAKRIRKSNVPEGMVSWASVKKSRLEEASAEEAQREKNRRKRLRDQRTKELDTEADVAEDSSEEGEDIPDLPPQDSAYPSSLSRILRLREMGVRGRRAWSANPHPVPDELKDHVFSDYGLQREYHGTSGDVISLAWNDDGRFAASSIAIADRQSMQYNMHRNLLVGDSNRGELEELPYHHVPRPVIEDANNINANHAMRESQDPRLFLTVMTARFCPQDSTRLFTAGMDNTLRHFDVQQDKVTHRYAIDHMGTVDALSIGGHGLVATGCHRLTQSINVFQCDADKYDSKMQLSARQNAAPVYPCALRWGIAPQHHNFLLAGFSGEEDIASATTGQTCLWDTITGSQIHLGGVIRNVFDVAWNPNPSSSSVAFAVAGNTNGQVVDKGMRSLIQCFAGGRSVVNFECRALDINDLVFCPYDDNLIAAGATDGCVYVWDKRSADRSQRPLHTLKHDESLNVLDHDRDAEVADTGVQFLSWGPTKTRLYSGSSDGIVKVWNPYRSPNNSHVDDMSGPTRDRSAVMSGAFSPDYSELLIGTENGRINLFKSGSGGLYLKPQKFKLHSAPDIKTEQEAPFIAARDLLETGQIEIKPCGAMPFSQAVQGPNYAGPFLKPRRGQRREAEERLDYAILAHTSLAADNNEAVFAKSAAEIQRAEQGVRDIQSRKAQARIAKPEARAFQQRLAESEAARRQLEMNAMVSGFEHCKLDCAVFPTQREDEDVEDSGRSELRIPGFMRYVADADVGLRGDTERGTLTCPGCFPPPFGSFVDTQKFCKACVLKRAQLTFACTRCGNAARAEIEEGKLPVCERCAFDCFRCGMSTAVVSSDSTLIRCGPCGLEWDMGALGYELVRSASSAPNARMEIDKAKGEDDDDLMDELGNGNREFYADRWQIPALNEREGQWRGRERV